MERRLKERIIGAVVLVGLAVLILPAVLNGPRESAPVAESQRVGSPRTETIELEAEAPEHDDAPAHLDAPVEVPQPPLEVTPPVEQPRANAEPQTRTEPETRIEPAPSPPATSRASRAAPPPAAAEPASGWAVQVGTFASRSNADAFAARLQDLGHAAFVLPHTADGKTYFRVRAGPVADLESARALQQRLAAEHIDGNPVRNP
jgi:DedD protein